MKSGTFFAPILSLSLEFSRGILLAVFSLQSTIALAVTPDIARATSEPREFVDSKVRIGGGPVSGLIFRHGNDLFRNKKGADGQLNTLYAFVSGGAEQVRVSLSTIDGRYLYNAINSVTTGPNRWVQIELNLKHVDFLRSNNYQIDELSVLITPKVTHLNEFEVYPASWGQFEPSASVQIYYKAESHKISIAKGKCRRLDTLNRQQFKYDRICQAPSTPKIFIRSRRGSDVNEPVKLKLWLPDS